MTALAVVPQSAEPIAERVRKLQSEVRRLALDHVGELEVTLQQTAQLCSDIAAGGDAYPVGVRELCARLSCDAIGQLQTIASIRARISR